MKILVVVNPRAGSGKAEGKARALCDRLRRSSIAFDVEQTRSGEDAVRIARSATARRADVLFAIGGDGTFNAVAQAAITPEGEPAEGPELALLPAGTGSDLQRTLELSDDLEEAVRRLREGSPRRVDLGVLECTDRDTGACVVRAFFNIGSVGLSAVIARRTNSAPKWLGGKLTYLSASWLSALGYRNQPIQIRVDGAEWRKGRVLFVAFANGRYFGGGMKVAPDADPTDGALDCVLIGDLTKLQTYALTSHIYEGTHLSRAGVEACRGTVFEVAPMIADQRVEIEIDGETPGILPARVRALPAAATLRC